MKLRFPAVVVAAAVGLALAGGASAQTGVSARLFSLGNGYLEGIVRDEATDLARNPAWLAATDGPFVLYRYRSQSWENMYLPRLEGNLLMYGDMRMTMASEAASSSAGLGSHELAVVGARAGGWVAGFSADWFVDDDEILTTYARSDLRRDYMYSSGASHDGDLRNREYWNIAFAAARRLGESGLLGCRLGFSGIYQRYERTNEYAYQDFDLKNNEYVLDQESYGSETRTGEFRRRRTVYGTAGLVVDREADGTAEVLLGLERSSLYARSAVFDSGIIWHYGDDPGYYEYDYDYLAAEDIRRSDRWTARLALRRSYASGTVLYIDGGAQWGAIDGWWQNLLKNYDYRNYMNERRCVDAGFASSNDALREFCTARLGNTRELRDDLALFGGISVAFSHFAWEDAPLFSSTVTWMDDLGAERRDGAQRLFFERRITTVEGALPVACEFTPRPWFAFRAGFVVGASWERDRSRTSIPVVDLDSAAASPAACAAPEDVDRRVTMIRTASVGFSFRWGERLSADIFTGSDLTPDSLTGMTIDLRYSF
ncbi:MAG: hypothetical protein JW876_10150 [Candidatus Krumholzibacteriota bacterium]|nr:hypothetical protein [Candidatus Krumholzibacteriota bacterium]